ncbi:MAG: hypothetical protein RR232_05765 [Clostridia bacterium]
MAIGVIDIGSNSIRYMGSGGKQLTTTRLAAGLDEHGMLRKENMCRSIDAIRTYVALARAQGLTPYAYATSAVRDAINRDEFVGRVLSECGIAVDVLTGEREAHYAYLGAADGDGGLLDIGGGSSQLITGGFSASYPMGCVRAMEAISGDTLEALSASLAAVCGPLYRFARIFTPHWTGVGGTITTLAAFKLGLSTYDSVAISTCVLTQGDVSSLIHAIYSIGAAARSVHPLLAQRHDVIVPGALLLDYIMHGMGISSLSVSDRDGMEGYAMYIAQL